MDRPEPVVEAIELRKSFDTNEVLRGLSFELAKGETLVVMGGSGSGKTVLLRLIAGLIRPDSGRLRVFGHSIEHLSEEALLPLRRRMGYVFQSAALFDSLSVRDNVAYPLHEHTSLGAAEIDERVMRYLSVVGLSSDVLPLLPSELSGGMTKRAALARALALDPELLFLDEPTSGLDPIGAAEFDELIATLQRTLGLTVFMVTHDLDSLYAICDRIIALADRRVIASGPVAAMLASEHPWLRAYFHGKRARRIETPMPAPTTAN